MQVENRLRAMLSTEPSSLVTHTRPLTAGQGGGGAKPEPCPGFKWCLQVSGFQVLPSGVVLDKGASARGVGVDNGWMDGRWMDRWMNGWVDSGWVDSGWVDGWMDAGFGYRISHTRLR